MLISTSILCPQYSCHYKILFIYGVKSNSQETISLFLTATSSLSACLSVSLYLSLSLDSIYIDICIYIYLSYIASQVFKDFHGVKTRDG